MEIGSALIALGLLAVLTAGVFLLHWDERTLTAGIVVTIAGLAAAVVVPFVTRDIEPSLVAIGGTMFMYGFQGISADRPIWFRRAVYVTGVALILGVVYSQS